MNQLQYHRPASLAEASKLLAASAEGRLLAGGQSLIASMKLGLLQPSALVDLSRVAELRGIRVDAGSVRIGAMTTHGEIAASADVRRAIPALADLAEGIGDRAVRAMGTIGGSLANSDPAACWPAAVLGLGATIQTDRRTIPADGFFEGLYETALAPGEIVAAVSFPIPAKAGYEKFRQPASRFAMVGVFVSQGASGVRVAVTGAGPCVFRVAALEAALAAKWVPASCQGVSVEARGLSNDLHASAEYRAHLIPVLAGRAVARAG